MALDPPCDNCSTPAQPVDYKQACSLALYWLKTASEVGAEFANRTAADILRNALTEDPKLVNVDQQELAMLADALETVKKRADRLVHKIRMDPAEAERRRLAQLLGRTANKMFNNQEPEYPSNLLDVIVAWLNGYEIGRGHAAVEKRFRNALAEAEAQLAKEAAAKPEG